MAKDRGGARGPGGLAGVDAVASLGGRQGDPNPKDNPFVRTHASTHKGFPFYVCGVLIKVLLGFGSLCLLLEASASPASEPEPQPAPQKCTSKGT